MTRYDELWKGLIEDIFPHFIPFFLPQYQHLFDLTRPVDFLDKELQDLNLQSFNEQETRFADKLVKVYTTDGGEKWVLVHIEVQGYRDPAFAERMYTYFYRILDRYHVPVTAIAIFTDDSKTYLPNQYTYDFAGTSNIYRFNTYKVLAQEEQQLQQSRNPFAFAILTVLLAMKKKKLEEENLLRLKIDLMKRMLNAGFSHHAIYSLMRFIKMYVVFAKPEITAKFEKEYDSLTQNYKTMGLIEMDRQEAKLEGRMQGRMEEGEKQRRIFVENLLRSTDFPDEKIANLAGVTSDFVGEIRKALLQ